MASVKKICDLYIKLNEIYGDKGFIPLTDSFDDNLELKIDELTTNVFKNIGCCRHIEIQGHDFFFTANLENIYFVQDEKGSGAEGTVFQVLDILDTSENKIKALREVECVKNTKALSEIEKGWNILRFLHELNNEQPIKGIQKLIGNVTPVQETLEFKRFFTISDLAYGSLFRYAIQEKSFGSEAMPRRVTLLRELLEGLEFAHNNAIVHGDIKPDNVLVYLTPSGQVSHLIICDWDGAACKDEVPLMATAIYRPSINDKNYKKYDVFAIAKTIAEALNQNKLNLEQQNLINPKFFNENSKNQRMKLLAEFRTNAVPAEITTSLVKGLSTPTPSIAELKDSFQMKAEN